MPFPCFVIFVMSSILLYIKIIENYGSHISCVTATNISKLNTDKLKKNPNNKPQTPHQKNIKLIAEF